MDSVAVTSNLTMLRVNGWQLYAWRDGDSVTLIDTGSAAALHDATGAQVLAGAGDAAAIRGEAAMAPPVFEDWEKPIHEMAGRL